MAKRKIKKMIRYALAPLLIPLTKITKRRKKNNVCIFHNGRCGSTVIVNLLGKHSKVHWDGEIFSKYFLNPDGKTFGRVDYEKNNAISILRNKMKDVFTQYYGFDVKRNHILWFGYSIPEYIQQLVKMGFDHFVVLERQNHLRTILSYTIARKAGVWHIHKHEAATEKAFHINPEKIYLGYEEIDLLTALGEMANYFSTLRNAFKDLNLPYLALTYEKDIRDDPKVGYEKIIDYIGLEIESPQTRFSRTNPFPIRNMVSNYDELFDYLSGTPYEWMLQE